MTTKIKALEVLKQNVGSYKNSKIENLKHNKINP